MHETGDWLARERNLRTGIDGARAMAPCPWRLIERSPESQQQYFMLRHGGRQWLGRKFATEGAKGPSLSNRIEPMHLLGDEVDIALSGNDVVFDFVLRRRDEAMGFLREAAGDPSSDVVFPFPARDAAGREWVCPPVFWSRVASNPAILAQDEYHVHPVCADTLRHWLPSGALVRDPGCSTGDFVAAMAEACPALRFEGRDISAAMIDIARSRHAGKAVSFGIADAADAEPQSCDGLIVRFLNAEVVTRAQAMALFDRLIPALRPGGVAVLFGHTPLLVPVRERAAAHGLRIHRCSAPATGEPGLFQFYVLGTP